MIAVLCARRDSVYHRLPLTDVYDAGRDALTFCGGVPVVAHPPCRGWGRLRWRSNHDQAELDLALHCARMVEANGGVLEHPSSSALWAAMGWPTGQPPSHPERGWTLHVDQAWWGHSAKKSTWLYIVGVAPKDIPALPYSLVPPLLPVVRMRKSDRERTPPAFATWLIELARRTK